MPKTIVLCFDGTNNQMTGYETNVLRLYRALERDENQITFYDPGVGTLADPMAISSKQKLIERSLDAAIGRSLCQNFSDAYRFLSTHYQDGDTVHMFGFSRGSYAARAVAGAVHMFGLLRPELLHLAPYVWAIYANDGGEYNVSSRFGGAHRFHSLFCVPPAPCIRLLGLWDTVSSFGWFWDFQSLPYTASNPSVELVRHAVSIDEHRAAFPSNLFYENGKAAASEKIKQVWFPGVHSDIGGGYPDKEGQLSKIALDWMIKEIQAIDEPRPRLNQSIVDEILGSTSKYSRPDPRGPMHNSLTGAWNLLEYVPRRQWKKPPEAAHADPHAPAPASPTGKHPPLWEKHWVGPHLYKPRPIPSGSWIHPAVRERMADPDYKPELPHDCVDVMYVEGRGYIPKSK